jgi:hypothetical protein
MKSGTYQKATVFLTWIMMVVLFQNCNTPFINGDGSLFTDSSANSENLSAPEGYYAVAFNSERIYTADLDANGFVIACYINGVKIDIDHEDFIECMSGYTATTPEPPTGGGSTGGTTGGTLGGGSTGGVDGGTVGGTVGGGSTGGTTGGTVGGGSTGGTTGGTVGGGTTGGVDGGTVGGGSTGGVDGGTVGGTVGGGTTGGADGGTVGGTTGGTTGGTPTVGGRTRSGGYCTTTGLCCIKVGGVSMCSNLEAY